MDEFESLLAENRSSVERFVKYRLPSAFDADDVLQEVYMAAHAKFATLKDTACFKAWLTGIARNKCNDYYRRRAKEMELPIEYVSESALSLTRMGITHKSVVHETISALASRDQEILYLCYFHDMSQADIAKKLGIPIGTVKSRLHTARVNFKEKYPCPPRPKGDSIMKKLPEILPDYTIEKSDQPPFDAIWEELMGWFIVPRLGEKLSWGIYDMPDKRLSEAYMMEVTGKAEVHGIEGVEITAETLNPAGNSAPRKFIAQLTDTHCRYLAESHVKDGVRRIYTFLDGDSFLESWGFGEDNCGNETHIGKKGGILREGSRITAADKPYLLDVVDRCTVTIGEKSFDTIRVMDVGSCNAGTVSEQYLDKNGRTILLRHFNRDDWAFDRYKQKWSDKLPGSERLIINGTTYVHWYDCITDYILQ